MMTTLTRLSHNETILTAKTILSLFKLEGDVLKLSYFDEDVKTVTKLLAPLKSELKDVESLSHEPINPNNLFSLFSLFQNSGSALRSVTKDLKNLEENQTLGPLIKRVYELTSCSELGKALDEMTMVLKPACGYLTEKMRLGIEFSKAVNTYNILRVGLTNLPIKIALGKKSKEEGRQSINDLFEAGEIAVTKATEFYSYAPSDGIKNVLSLLNISTVFGVNLKKVQEFCATKSYYGCVILQANGEVFSLPELEAWQEKDSLILLKVLENINNDDQKREREERRETVLMKDISDFIHALDSTHPSCMTAGEIEEKIFTLGNLENNFEVYRLNLNGKLNEIPIVHDGFVERKNIKEALSKKRIELLDAKEAARVHIIREENARKADREEASRLMPRVTLPDLHSGENFIGWSTDFEIIQKLAGEGEAAKLKMLALVKSSLKNAEDKEAAETIYSLPNLVAFLTTKYVRNSNLVQATLRKVLDLDQPKTLKQSLMNMLDIQRGLNCIKAANLSNQVSMEMIQKLEFGAFTVIGFEEYLHDRLKNNKMVNVSTTCEDKEEEKYNVLDISTSILSEYSCDTDNLNKDFFMKYVDLQIVIVRKVLRRKNELTTSNMKRKLSSNSSPTLDRKKFKEDRFYISEEMIDGGGKKKNKPPSKPCPIGCRFQSHFYGSASYCPIFKKMDIDEKEYSVEKYKMCRKCLKSHKPMNKCKAPLCADCAGQHSVLLCTRKTEVMQTDSEENRENIEDNDEGQKVDDQHDEDQGDDNQEDDDQNGDDQHGDDQEDADQYDFETVIARWGEGQEYEGQSDSQSDEDLTEDEEYDDSQTEDDRSENEDIEIQENHYFIMNADSENFPFPGRQPKDFETKVLVDIIDKDEAGDVKLSGIEVTELESEVMEQMLEDEVAKCKITRDQMESNDDKSSVKWVGKPFDPGGLMCFKQILSS